MQCQAKHAIHDQLIQVTSQNGEVKCAEISNAEFQQPGSLKIFPGLVDLQVNGYHGTDMADATLGVSEAEVFCRELAQLGVTGFLATLTTNSVDQLGAALANLDRLATESSLFGAMLLGVHLEGPFISAEDGPRGAHPKQFCMSPQLDVFKALQEKANGRIRIVTMSPEYETANEFIEKIAPNVIVSIGHTAATCEQIQRAVDHGATMSTHLGNGMHKEILRHPNYLWEQMADDRLNAGLIADGVHLDRSTIKSLIRAKTVERCFLVSDSTVLAGEPPGVYQNSALGDVEVTEDRRLVIAGQSKYNAGAYRPLIDAFPFLLDNSIVPVRDVLKMSSENPLRLLGLDPLVFETKSFVLYKLDTENKMDIKATIVDNQPVFVP